MYDVIVLGGGPGGNKAAELAAKNGLKTAMIEKDRLGGTCLNRGCIPTKAYYARIVGGHGSVEEMWAHKEQIVGKLQEGISTLMRMSGVDVVHGTGTLQHVEGTKVVKVQTSDGERLIEGKHLIIATGARSLAMAFEGSDLPEAITGDYAVTYPELWKYPECGNIKSVAVIGAGVIAVELAVLLRRMGREVTILKHSDQVLRRSDKDIKKKLIQSLKKMKIKMVDYFTPEKAVREEGHIALYGTTPKGAEKIICDRFLLASSMVPILDGYGLETSGINYSKKGITVDKHMQTNIPDVYAIGDVTGGMMLAHLAEYHALAAIEHILGREYIINPDHVPWCVFTDPEIAVAGITEDEAEARNIPIKTARAYFLGNGMAQALNETDGFIKVIASKENGQILGVHIAGPEASSLIGEAALAVAQGMTARDVARTIHPHPTLTECFKDALFRLEE
jgi:dihydrolipoamide dehydrogenase